MPGYFVTAWCVRRVRFRSEFMCIATRTLGSSVMPTRVLCCAAARNSPSPCPHHLLQTPIYPIACLGSLEKRDERSPTTYRFVGRLAVIVKGHLRWACPSCAATLQPALLGMPLSGVSNLRPAPGVFFLQESHCWMVCQRSCLPTPEMMPMWQAATTCAFEDGTAEVSIATRYHGVVHASFRCVHCNAPSSVYCTAGACECTWRMRDQLVEHVASPPATLAACCGNGR